VPRFRVPTDSGTFEVETDIADPTDEELLALVGGQPAPEGPGLARRGAAFAARVVGPIVGGIGGAAVGGPVGAVAGAAAGGASGAALAEKILGEPLDPMDIALSGVLAAVPAGPFARAAARPGLTVAKQVLLHAAEGATQGALAAQAESIAREGEPAGIAQTLGGAAGGAVLGGGAGLIVGRAAHVPGAPAEARAVAKEVEAEAQGPLFQRVPGLAGEVPPKTAPPPERVTELQDSVDRLFPHLGDLERTSLKATIADAGDDLLAHSRSVQSIERTDALAQELVLDLSRPLPKGTALNAEQMRHVVNLVAPLQERVTALAGEVAANPGDDAVKLDLQRASTRLANVLFSYSGARAEAGRTLNILREQAKALDVGDAKAILAARRLGVDADSIAKVIAASPNDPVSQYRQLRDMYRPDWKDKLKWYYYTNILSGPQTHVRNLVSNTVNLALRPATTPFAAAADAAGAKLTGRQREVFLGEAPIQLQQMYHALPDAWNKMAFMFRNGFSLSDVQDFEVRPAEMPGGVAVNVVGRALGAADEFFRGLGFSMELHSGAFARARKQALAEGLDGQELLDRTSALTADLLDKKPADLMTQAEEFSRRVTFQEQDNAVARGLLAFRDAVPGGSFLVPFVRTPANIFRQGLHFSPAGLLMKGAGPGRAGAQRVGEAVLGSTLLVPVAWLAAAGKITGAAPTDAGERDAFYGAGKQPNSILIGDRWVSYAEAGPLVLPFTIVANAADAYRRSGGKINQETVGTIVGQVGKSLLDQSYLTSLSAVFEALNDPERYGEAFVQNLASGLIPLVGLQRNVTRATDPYVRQATGVVQGLQRNVPGESKKLLPKLDALGQPIEHPTGPGALLVPKVSPVRADPVREELARVGVQIEPLRRSKSVTVGDEKVPLDDASDFAIRKSTGAFRVVLLRDLFADPEYQSATKEEQAAAVTREVRRAGSAALRGARELLGAGSPVTFEALTEGVDLGAQPAPGPTAPAPPASPTTTLPAGPPSRFDDVFGSVGARTGIDPTLLKAVAKVESNFNPGARSEKHAVGLLQLLPATFAAYADGVRRVTGKQPRITDPTDNTIAGALLYRDLLGQTGGNIEAAARLYHGGPSPKQHGPKTLAYGKKVAAAYAALRE